MSDDVRPITKDVHEPTNSPLKCLTVPHVDATEMKNRLIFFSSFVFLKFYCLRLEKCNLHFVRFPFSNLLRFEMQTWLLSRGSQVGSGRIR